jgi:basic membrane lipoprotein Med (substrate-binding protein (PBP1-ABC) superfamily)
MSVMSINTVMSAPKAALTTVALALGITCSAPTYAASLKIAVLLPGPTSDEGYDADGGRTADALKSQLKAETAVVENVSVANQADLYRQFATSGYNLIIGWGGQFTDGAVQVSEEFPDIKFLVVNSGASNGNNLASTDEDLEQWEFVGGFVTAKLSSTNVIGWIGGQCFPATAEQLHGVEQGAKFASATVKVLSTYTGDFEDPIKAQQAAQAMIESSATALTGNLNNGYFGVYKAAEAHGNVPVVTEWGDNHKLAPKVIASSILKSQSRFVVQVAKTATDGTWQGKHYQFTLPSDWGPVMAKTDLLPDNIYQESLDVQKQISDGKIKVRHDTSCGK